MIAKARCLDKARRLDPPNVTVGNETTELAKPTEYSLVELLTDLDIGPMVHKCLDLAGALVLARVCKSLHKLVLDETTRARNFWADAEAENGHRSSWKWASQTICAENAAETGYLSMLVYLHENGCKFNGYTCEKAAENGHLDCLQYAHTNGGWWGTETCEAAAGMGQLVCLQYAHENGCEWDKYVCEMAAKHGELDCLQYAHENGCLWDEQTCWEAAEGGHLACLQYAHENGCPWDDMTCGLAANNSHWDCLRYAIDNKCPGWEEYE